MTRTEYVQGSVITLNNYLPNGSEHIHDSIQYKIKIESVLGKGSSCIAYKGVTGEGIPVKLKHYLPKGFFSGSKLYKSSAEDKFRAAYLNQLNMLQTELTRNTTAGLFGLFVDAKGGFWTMVQSTVGKTLDRLLPELSLNMLFKYLHNLAEGAKAYHLNRWVLMDIKPENVLVLDSLGVKGICFFDFDSFIHMDAVEKGEHILVSSTPDFAAPEILAGFNSKSDNKRISYKADYYAVGAIAFSTLFGRIFNQSENLETAMDFAAAEKHFSEEISPELTQAIKIFLRRTLAYKPEDRFENDDELLGALETLIISSDSKKPLLKRVIPRASDSFTGRKKEINEISELISRKVSPLFIAGEGGIGKTELILKTIETLKNTNFYFTVYDKSIKETIINLPVENLERTKTTPDGSIIPVDEDELYGTVMQMLRTSYTADTVLIIDSFDISDEQAAQLEQSAEYRELLELPVRLVFTTRTRSVTPNVYSLDSMSKNDLYDMLKRHCTQIRDKEIRNILYYTCGHTMTVELVARCIGDAKRISVSRAIKSLAKGYRFYRQNADGQKSIIVYYFFAAMRFSKHERTTLMFSKLIPQQGIDNKLIEILLNPKQQEAAFALFKMGWLKYDNQTNIWAVHPIIRTIIGKTSSIVINTKNADKLRAILLIGDKNKLLHSGRYKEQISEMLANVSRTNVRRIPQMFMITVVTLLLIGAFMAGAGKLKPKFDNPTVDLQFYTENTQSESVIEDRTAIFHKIQMLYPNAQYATLHLNEKTGYGFSVEIPVDRFAGKDATLICATFLASQPDLYIRFISYDGDEIYKMRISDEFIISAMAYQGSEYFIFDDVSRNQPLIGITFSQEFYDYLYEELKYRIPSEYNISGYNMVFSLNSETESPFDALFGPLIGFDKYFKPVNNPFEFTHWSNDGDTIYLTNIHYTDSFFYQIIASAFDENQISSEWFYTIKTNALMDEYSWIDPKNFKYSGRYQKIGIQNQGTKYLTFTCRNEDEITDEIFELAIGRFCRELDLYEEYYSVGYSILHPRKVVVMCAEDGAIAKGADNIVIEIPGIQEKYKY